MSFGFYCKRCSNPVSGTELCTDCEKDEKIERLEKEPEDKALFYEDGGIHYCSMCNAPVASTDIDPARDAIKAARELEQKLINITKERDDTAEMLDWCVEALECTYYEDFWKSPLGKKLDSRPELLKAAGLIAARREDCESNPTITESPAALEYEGVRYNFPSENMTAASVVECLRKQGLACELSEDGQSVMMPKPNNLPVTKINVISKKE